MSRGIFMPTTVKCETVVDGFMPSEKIASIKGADGKVDEVVVSVQSITGNQLLLASEIGRRDNEVLVELPRESASGRWRMWVKASSVGA
jgi:hypothetical protein